MNEHFRVGVATVALYVGWGASAWADCVVLDASRDSLSGEEQRAALLLLSDALVAEGRTVGAAPCADTWTVNHVRLGESITVRLSQGDRSEQMAVSRIEELPAAYERLVRAILTGQPVSSTADRDSVTSAEVSPRRVQAEPLVYVQLGGGVTGLDAPEGGTAVGFGYRHSLDNLAIDLGLMHFIIPSSIEESEQFSMSLVEMSVLYYFDGGAAHSLYAGGGLGYGLSAMDSAEDVQLGLQGQAAVGYELLRQSTIRLFPQVDVSLPFYTLDDGSWLPSASLTLNIAFQPPQKSVPWWAVLF